jgi:hypothetical protein
MDESCPERRTAAAMRERQKKLRQSSRQSRDRKKRNTTHRDERQTTDNSTQFTSVIVIAAVAVRSSTVAIIKRHQPATNANLTTGRFISLFFLRRRTSAAPRSGSFLHKSAIKQCETFVPQTKPPVVVPPSFRRTPPE